MTEGRFAARRAARRAQMGWSAEEEAEVNRRSPEYARWIQRSLNRIMGLNLAVDGVIGPQTRSAIRGFQAQHGLVVDGVVGPITESAMIAAGADPPPGYPGATPTPPSGTCTASTINAQLPRSGPGFYSYSPGASQYGIPDTILALTTIGAGWLAAHLQGPRIGVGDISRCGGGPMPGHHSHRLGVDVDILPMRNDGQETGVVYQSPAYSRALTQELVNRIRGNGVLRVQYIFFNDSSVTGVSPWPNHDNHLHVRFFPPGASSPEAEYGEYGEAEVNRRSPEYARWIQQSLNRVLGLNLAVDGIIGPATRSAIRSFQAQHGLAVDGIVGPQTDARLRQLLGGQGPAPAPPSPTQPAMVLDDFDFDRDDLKPAHRTQIARLATLVVASQDTDHPVVQVRLVGHTDAAGSRTYNLDLGRRRAENVRRTLTQALDQARPGLSSRVALLVETRGEDEPASDAPPRNRRVESFLVSGSRVTPPPVPPIPPRPPNRWLAALGVRHTRRGNLAQSLIDGTETFRSMAAAIRTATGAGHYIYLLGWWLDNDLPLVSGDPTSTINALFSAAARQGVQVRAMLWDQTGSTKNTAEVRAINQLPGAGAILDNHQLSYFVGSHHQKVIVVNGNQGLIGFCGGVDINWDRIRPRASGSSSGTAGAPLHDVHCRIAGPAAHDLLGVFIQRWFANSEHTSIDQNRGPLRGLTEPVPPIVGNHFVRIGRTFNGRTQIPGSPAVDVRDRSAQEIILSALSAARRFIYIEDQYLVNMCAAEALRRTLPRIEHLTILMPHSGISDLPQVWRRRKMFIDHVRSGPNAHKVRVFCLFDPTTRGVGPHTYVHSKMFIIDDELAIIGSANCNRRGWESDSEVVAAIFDDIPTDARGYVPFAQALRRRLWAEHLNVAQSAVADGVSSAGLWLSAIPGKRVVPYDPNAGRDSPASCIPTCDTIWDSAADPAAPLAHAACCRLYGQSCR